MQNLQNSKFKVKLCQILVRTGDLNGNFKQIIEQVEAMSDESIDLLVFPEAALTGYCCGALWENVDFVVDQKKLLFEISTTIPFNRAVVLGFINYLGIDKDGYPILTNSAAILNNGHINIYDKQLLATRDHHEDVKYFKAGTESKVFDLTLWQGNLKIGVPICEDLWFNDHERNIPLEMKELGAELLVSINQSYFHYDKMQMRIQLANDIVDKCGIPLIYVNAVGVGDIVKNVMIFDGGSFAINGNNHIKIVSRFESSNTIVSSSWLFANCTFSKSDIVYKCDKYKQITDAIIFAQREIFELSNIEKAQVHLSGGIDSAVVAVLSVLAETVDADTETVFITNPSNENSTETKNYAMHVASKLNRKLYWEFINETVEALSNAHQKAFSPEKLSVGVLTCAHAVGRTVMGLMASHEFGTGIVPTANHTEIVLGWANFHDIGSIGVYAPIGDLTKTEVFELAEHLNCSAETDLIPTQLYDGSLMPAAELPDAKFDPIDYFLQSGICANMIRLRMSRKQQMCAFNNRELRLEYFKPLKVYGMDPNDLAAVYKTEEYVFEQALEYAYRKARTSVYKAAQGAPILILSPRSRGFSNRETLYQLYKG